MTHARRAIAAVAVALGACSAGNNDFMELKQWMEQERREAKPDFKPPPAITELAPPPPGLASLPDPFAPVALAARSTRR